MEHFIFQLSSVHDVYVTDIQPLFSNIDRDAKSTFETSLRSLKKIYKDKLKMKETTKSELEEEAKKEAFYRENALRLTRDMMVCSMVTTLYHIWEQQFIDLIKDNVIVNSSRKSFSSIFEVINLLSEKNIFVEKMQCWNQINEMRLLNNFIKHGQGSSLNKLKEASPGIFQSDRNYSILVPESIHISGDKVRWYVSSLISFWRELPKTLSSESIIREDGNFV